MYDLPAGINTTLGMCGTTKNSYQVHPSPAYTINRDTILTIGSNQAFPNGFPVDFSILLVIRPTMGLEKVPIFTFYSSDSEEVLSMLVGKEIALFYQEIDAPYDELNTINFGVGIDDGKWHRIGISMKGNAATLTLDCNRQITRRLDRRSGATIATDGLILTGVQLEEEAGYFTGDVQLMAVVDTPDAGFELCTKYAPDCEQSYITSGRSNRAPGTYSYSYNKTSRTGDGGNVVSYTTYSETSSGSGREGSGLTATPNPIGGSGGRTTTSWTSHSTSGGRGSGSTYTSSSRSSSSSSRGGGSQTGSGGAISGYGTLGGGGTFGGGSVTRTSSSSSSSSSRGGSEGGFGVFDGSGGGTFETGYRTTSSGSRTSSAGGSVSRGGSAAAGAGIGITGATGGAGGYTIETSRSSGGRASSGASAAGGKIYLVLRKPPPCF